MMKKLHERVYSRMRRELGLPALPQVRKLLDREFSVHEGTIRTKADQDDAWLLACALHSEVVFDVGANLGQAAFVLLLSRKVRRLVLVEANPEALLIAAQNLIRNHLITKVNLVCAFAGDQDDQTVQFWTVGSGAAGSLYASHAETAKKQNSSISVPTITLDTLADLYELAPDLIKIDVEGAETIVLEGCRRTTTRCQPKFFVEMHSTTEMPMIENGRRLLQWCAELNYAAWYLRDKVQMQSPEMIQDRGRCHLLLQPADRPFPDWLRPIEQGASLETVAMTG